MKEKHYAYKITHGTSGVACPHTALEHDRMVDLLNEIDKHQEGIFWVFKQLDGKTQEPLCIVDCDKKRIYFHYSGEVEPLDETIANLNH